MLEGTKDKSGVKMVDFPEKDLGTGQAGNKFSIISFILLLLLIISIAFLVYLKNQNGDMTNLNIKELVKSSFSNSSGRSAAEKLISEVEYDSKEHPAFAVYKNSIIKCTKDNIMCMNKKGEVLWTKSVTVSNPLIRVAGTNLLIADLNGRYFYVINGKEIKWDHQVDSNIVSADINEKGYITIVKEMKGYKGAIEVYDPQGNWVFTSAKGESFIVSAKVLPSCDKVVANMLDTSGVNADTKFEIINMAGKTVSSIVNNNAIFPSMWTMSGDNVMAVSDTGAVLFNEDKKTKWKQTYKKVYSSNTTHNKNTILAVWENAGKGTFDANQTDIVVINTKGEIESKFPVEGEVLSIEIYGNILALNTGREILFTNFKGKLMEKYSSKIDILDIKFFNKDEVAVITRNNLVVTKIN
jgi:hypothetical protein